MNLLRRATALLRRQAKPYPVCASAALLGENPVWSSREQALYWIDILAGLLHRYTPSNGSDRTWKVGEEIHALSLDVDGRPVVAIGNRLLRVEGASGSLTECARFEGWNADCRFNDCTTDADGRLWIGSMDRRGQRPLGRLLRVDAGGNVVVALEGLTISNGPAFTAGGKRLYIADSPRREIYAVEIAADGATTDRQVFVRMGDKEGYPDGMAVDVEDHLWVAHYDGWRISRFDPSGKCVASVRFPVARVTACAFGGHEMRTLYVTTASDGLSVEDRRRQPLAGHLFAVALNVAGLPVSPCAL